MNMKELREILQLSPFFSEEDLKEAILRLVDINEEEPKDIVGEVFCQW